MDEQGHTVQCPQLSGELLTNDWQLWTSLSGQLARLYNAGLSSLDGLINGLVKVKVSDRATKEYICLVLPYFLSIMAKIPFTKPPLFQRNMHTCSGKPSFESCVEVKAQ